jgi:acylphosphatase
VTSGGGERVARRATVHGHVQGVFFRQSTVDRARRLGVAGWVRNTDEGTVELHAEGDADAVGRLVEWAHDGPRGARVDRVDVADVPVEDLSDFTTR